MRRKIDKKRHDSSVDERQVEGKGHYTTRTGNRNNKMGCFCVEIKINCSLLFCRVALAIPQQTLSLKARKNGQHLCLNFFPYLINNLRFKLTYLP